MKFRYIAKNTFFLLFSISTFLISCSEKGEDHQEMDQIITETKEEFAPDKRVALLDIAYEKEGEAYIINGETNLPEAKKAFLAKLDSQNVSYNENIKVLPDTSVAASIYGIISNSVANLRGEGKHSAELVTQATLGMPVKVWKKEGSWYLIQTPDNYLAWVDAGGLQTMENAEFETWKNAEKIIYKNAYGQSYKEASINSKPVSDLVTGAILEILGESGDFYQVQYPDGKKAFVVKADAMQYSEWLSGLETSETSLVSTAESLMGLPYLWGGTSSKGVDCSGFTKTIYFMNGMILPRDASQQVREGKLVDSVGDFKKLAVGDLLFFGSKATDSTKERVVHVGMWIGENQFIHSSGNVHISSMDAASENFDDFNKNRYLRTKRLLGEQTNGLRYLKNEDIYMKNAQDTVHN